jgi:hypothetical protein
LFQGRLVHRQIQKLQERGPLEHSADFTRLYRSLLGAVTQPDPGADGRAGGPEAQLRTSMGHLRLNT